MKAWEPLPRQRQERGPFDLGEHFADLLTRGPVNPLVGDSLLDPDSDGMTNLYEYQHATDPCVSSNPDSDGDGLTNAQEAIYGTDPYDPDSDDDGLDDGLEVLTYTTDPLSWDTDHDALPDAYEVANMTGHTVGLRLDPKSAGDGDLDFDSDGNANKHEYWNGSSPWVANAIPANGPGCAFWGDATGDGIIDAGDVTAIRNRVLGISWTYPPALPPLGDTQDMDMDNIPSGVDLSIIRNMLLIASLPLVESRPTALDLYQAPGSSVLVGRTCHLTVEVRNTGGSAGNHTSGIGVIFEKVSGAGTATFLGGDGAQSSTNKRYDLSGPIASSGRANIVLRIDSAGTIVIQARIPQDGDPGGKGRTTNEVTSSSATFRGK